MNITDSEKKLFNQIREQRLKASEIFKTKAFRNWWRGIVDKYNESAHFIYELLQNADDVGATYVEIILSKEGMYFKHNGTIPFSISTEEEESNYGHINAITGVANSTKNEDSQKIGKFGLGFKAVFAYSKEPYIYDDKFWFKIVDYVVPEELLEDSPIRKKGETLFYFPFSNEKEAFKDIEKRLLNLNNPILFLRNLRNVYWRYEEDPNFVYEYSKEIHNLGTKDGIVYDKIKVKNGEQKSTIILFTRKINIPGNGKHNINIGYFLDEQGNINTDIRPKVFCFFPTSEKTDLCFICHAPFLLVDSRQQIKNNESLNVFLVEQLAKLQARSLPILRDIGLKSNHLLIDGNLFKIVPLTNDDDDDETLINSGAFYETCLDIISKEKLLLSNTKTYISTKNARICSPVRMMSIIKDTQLQQLESDRFVCFLHKNICSISDDTINSYIKEALEVKEFSSYTLATRIDERFMQNQSMDWVISLYKFLKNHASSLYNPEWGNKFNRHNAPIKYAPIILTSKGQWVSAYKGEEPNVYFPLDVVNSDYNFISEELMELKDAKKFLEDLGIRKPDQVDYIKSIILPKYEDDEIVLNQEELINDLDFIISYYTSLDNYSRKKLINELKESILIWGDNNKLNNPEELYEYSNIYVNELVKYSDCSFVDYDYYEILTQKYGKNEMRSFFSELGVKTNVELKETSVYHYQLSYEQKKSTEGVCHTAVEYYDYNIKGLEKLFKHIYEKRQRNEFSKKFSEYLWNILADTLEEGTNWSKGRMHYRYYSWYNKAFDSSLFILLSCSKWLLDGLVPSEVYQEDLAISGYKPSQKMFALFDIKTRERSLRELGASESQIRDAELVQQIKQLGIRSVDDLKGYAEWLKSKSVLDFEMSKINNRTQIVPDDQSKNSENEKTDFIKLDEKDFTQRDEIAVKDLDDMFSHTYKKREIKEVISADEDIINEGSKVLQQIEEAEEKQNHIMELRQIVSESNKYSKEWFESLLELEYNNTSSTDSDNSKAIKIHFGSVKKEPGSERIYILKDPSRSIPLWIEEIGDIEVIFSFMHMDDLKVKFEVANVRDFSLRLKHSNSLTSILSKVDWNKVTKASISISNKIDLTNKMKIAFKQLNLPDNYNLKANLTNNISFIFGPPGTGKTTRLADIIIRRMTENVKQRILVLAPTNTACDELANKIISKTNDAYSWLARFVATSDEDLEDIVIDRESCKYNDDKCCIISTMARLCFDGFNGDGGYHSLRDINWDIIICDEASMIPLADITHTIYNFKNIPILIAGDPMQIKPIVSEQEWKDENIYTMIKLDRFDNPRTEPIQFEIENLNTQYRSLPPIGNLFSQYAYNGMLKHHRSMLFAPKIKFGKLDLRAVNFIPFKVEKYDSVFGAKKLDGSNVHIYSVLLVVETCRYVAKKYGERYVEDFTIGVICPYASQAQLIENLISQINEIPQNVKITVGTIHRFQGGQCNLIFAVFNPPRGMKLAADRIFLNNKNIVNVAISRAQDFLCILLPHCETEGYESLYELNSIGVIAQQDSSNVNVYTCDELEEYIFGKKFYIENNTFVTSHQLANVYTKPVKKYEIRIDENSVDIQLGTKL